MGYGHEAGTAPFCAVGDPEHELVRLSLEWEDNEGEVHNGWTMDGDDTVDNLYGARWTKGELVVVVIDTNYMTGDGEHLFLSETREALETWIADHGLDVPVHENIRLEQVT